jgi:site-specific DNA-methyltransferase (adenine-specific)
MKQNSITNVEDMNVSPHSGKPLVMGSTVFNEDCMTVMARYPDKFFDLAVVDPPYGIKAGNVYSEKSKVHGNSNAPRKAYKIEWDNEIPEQQYWDELFRVSKNQIVWGGNYMTEYLPPSSGWIAWKKRDVKLDFNQLEFAWTSNLKTGFADILWSGYWQPDMKNKEVRIHPTQKPKQLYDWIFANYASEGNLILDTHLGSGSSRIAAHKAGLSFVGCEIDKDYFDAQEKRFKEFVSQLRIF